MKIGDIVKFIYPDPLGEHKDALGIVTGIEERFYSKPSFQGRIHVYWTDGYSSKEPETWLKVF